MEAGGVSHKRKSEAFAVMPVNLLGSRFKFKHRSEAMKYRKGLQAEVYCKCTLSEGRAG